MWIGGVHITNHWWYQIFILTSHPLRNTRSYLFFLILIYSGHHWPSLPYAKYSTAPISSKSGEPMKLTQTNMPSTVFPLFRALPGMVWGGWSHRTHLLSDVPSYLRISDAFLLLLEYSRTLSTECVSRKWFIFPNSPISPPCPGECFSVYIKGFYFIASWILYCLSIFGTKLLQFKIKFRDLNFFFLFRISQLRSTLLTVWEKY